MEWGVSGSEGERVREQQIMGVGDLVSYLIFLIRFSNRIRLFLFYIRYLFYR
jgi:hypothetical protein